MLARGVRILLRGTTRLIRGTPPGACFPAIVTRSAGALCERACGMSFTCRHHREVVRLSATSVMLAGAAQRDACDGVCACAKFQGPSWNSPRLVDLGSSCRLRWGEPNERLSFNNNNYGRPKRTTKSPLRALALTHVDFVVRAAGFDRIGGIKTNDGDLVAPFH